MKNTGSVEIDRSIGDVFRVTCDDVANWSGIVVEDEVIEDQSDGGVGTTFRTVTDDRGKRMEFQGVVTRNEPPHLHAARMVGEYFDIETEFAFEDLACRTRVTQRADVTGKGFFKLFLFLFGWMMNKSSCKASEDELNSLKRYCEEKIPAESS